jgi:hypothetical protein
MNEARSNLIFALRWTSDPTAVAWASTRATTDIVRCGSTAPDARERRLKKVFFLRDPV